MSVTIEPKISDPETSEGEPEYSHIVNKRDWERGYFHGAWITAICGHRFIPSRDPDRYPTCPKCLEIKRQVEGDNN